MASNQKGSAGQGLFMHTLQDWPGTTIISAHNLSEKTISFGMATTSKKKRSAAIMLSSEVEEDDSGLRKALQIAESLKKPVSVQRALSAFAQVQRHRAAVVVIASKMETTDLALEEMQEEQIRKATEPETIKIEIDYEDQQAALELLKSPNLLERILTDFNACGVIGEDTNKLVGYLGATSRKFTKPLGIIVQSTSAAGKTTLMESILAFMPDEERVKYSAMTGQALFYLGKTNIKHKILAIAEEEGAERATYALKLLPTPRKI